MTANATRKGLIQLIQNTGTDLTYVSVGTGTYSTDTGRVERSQPQTYPFRAAVTDYMEDLLPNSTRVSGQRKILVSNSGPFALSGVVPKRGDRITGLVAPIEVEAVKDLVMSGINLGWILYCVGGSR